MTARMSRRDFATLAAALCLTSPASAQEKPSPLIMRAIPGTGDPVHLSDAPGAAWLTDACDAV